MTVHEAMPFAHGVFTGILGTLTMVALWAGLRHLWRTRRP